MAKKDLNMDCVAKGAGLVIPSDKPNELDILNLREKMQVPEIPFPKEIPELSFRVKISKRRLRRLRQMAMGKKPHLPRKLKKAAKHADFENLLDRTKPAGYPRTKWVRRLSNIVHRIMLRQHRRFMYRLLKQQFLYQQHPGMLTYDDAPSNPAQHHKDLYAGSELVLDKNQQQRLANILNLNEK